MALVMRLARKGKKHKPFFWVLVQEKERTPKGKFFEKIGYYDPSTNPITLKIEKERVQHWLSLGVKPSVTVAKLIDIAEKGVQEKPKKEKPFKKKFASEPAAAPADKTPSAPEKQSAPVEDSKPDEGDAAVVEQQETPSEQPTVTDEQPIQEEKESTEK
jgi:small subunit ribosomal protein S16